MSVIRSHGDADRWRAAEAAVRDAAYVKVIVAGPRPWHLSIQDQDDNILTKIQRVVLTLDHTGLSEGEFYFLTDTPIKKLVQLLPAPCACACKSSE